MDNGQIFIIKAKGSSELKNQYEKKSFKENDIPPGSGIMKLS